MPNIDLRKSQEWEQVPSDDPMCPEHNDDRYRSLVLYRKPIELALTDLTELHERTVRQTEAATKSWTDLDNFYVSTFAAITANPVPHGPISTRDEILARLEDFYRPETFACYSGHDRDLAVANQLRKLIGLPVWTVHGLRRDLLAFWKRYRTEPFSKSPHYYAHNVGPTRAKAYRIEWGMPANPFEWFVVQWRKNVK